MKKEEQKVARGKITEGSSTCLPASFFICAHPCNPWFFVLPPPGVEVHLMRRAIITVGLGFGDEGKGATVDYLAREYEADLVVRYCGGSQAGHNVQLPDGRRHTFAQFGAGTFAGAGTWLAPNVVIDPQALLREANRLAELGVADPLALVTIHSRCLVATVWHRVLNHARELARGDDRHGSCGQGIGEARSYWLKHGGDAVCAEDLLAPDVLRGKLELLRQRALLEVQDVVERISPERLRELDLWRLNAEAVALDLNRTARKGLSISSAVPECQTAVFEGAQGVLLDEYRGFHPQTTWSTVTPHHAWELVRQLDVEAVAVLGVTRAYATRHGEGPLPTFSPDLTRRLPDPGNPPNPWQGGLRCGWLDLPLLRYAAAGAGPLDGIVVNHLDQLREGECLTCEEYKHGPLVGPEAPNLAWQSNLTRQLGQAEPVLLRANPDQIVRRVGEIAPVALTGMGPTHEHRTPGALRFRKRKPDQAFQPDNEPARKA
jgi:adenylosuccinate synthase